MRNLRRQRGRDGPTGRRSGRSPRRAPGHGPRRGMSYRRRWRCPTTGPSTPPPRSKRPRPRSTTRPHPRETPGRPLSHRPQCYRSGGARGVTWPESHGTGPKQPTQAIIRGPALPGISRSTMLAADARPTRRCSTGWEVRSSSSLTDRVPPLSCRKPVLAILYPAGEEELEAARAHLEWFLIQYWGGPRIYEEHRGAPRLRMRHAPFPIGGAERDAWLWAHDRCGSKGPFDPPRRGPDAGLLPDGRGTAGQPDRRGRGGRRAPFFAFAGAPRREIHGASPRPARREAANRAAGSVSAPAVPPVLRPPHAPPAGRGWPCSNAPASSPIPPVRCAAEGVNATSDCSRSGRFATA